MGDLQVRCSLQDHANNPNYTAKHDSSLSAKIPSKWSDDSQTNDVTEHDTRRNETHPSGISGVSNGFHKVLFDSIPLMIPEERTESIELAYSGTQ